MKNPQQVLDYKQELQIRQRTLQSQRFRCGIHAIVKAPWKIFPLLLPIILAVWVGGNKTKIPAPSDNSPPALVSLWQLSVVIGIAVLSVLILLGLVNVFGTPIGAKRIDHDVAVALGFSRSSENYALRPFLISYRKIRNSDAKEYIFWSRWVDINRWNEPTARKAILWALQGHSDEKFLPGKEKCTVVVQVGSGVVPQERESPKDPLFM